MTGAALRHKTVTKSEAGAADSLGQRRAALSSASVNFGLGHRMPTVSGGPGRISDGLTEAINLLIKKILRVETRTLQILTATRGIGFPCAKQVVRITRERVATATGKRGVEVVYARRHLRRRDRSTTRIGNGAQFMASLGNTAINRHRLDGATNIAETCRADRQPSPRPPQPAKSQLSSQAC